MEKRSNKAFFVSVGYGGMAPARDSKRGFMRSRNRHDIIIHSIHGLTYCILIFVQPGRSETYRAEASQAIPKRMGRLDHPKKPTAWNPEPYQVAAAAARKAAQRISANRDAAVLEPGYTLQGGQWMPLQPDIALQPDWWTRCLGPEGTFQPNFGLVPAAPPPVQGPRQPSDVANLVKHFDERELRTVFANIIRNNADARREFEEFYDAPQGSRLRPFDFDRCLDECLEELSKVGDDEWNSERYLFNLIYDVTSSVKRALGDIRNVCMLSTTDIEAKVKGVEAAIRVAAAIERTDDFLTEHVCGEDAKGELMTMVHEAVTEIVDGMLSSNRDFFGCDSFPALYHNLERRQDFSELLERMKERQASMRYSAYHEARL
jgi:hypothetical protein